MGGHNRALQFILLWSLPPPLTPKLTFYSASVKKSKLCGLHLFCVLVLLEEFYFNTWPCIIVLQITPTFKTLF